MNAMIKIVHCEVFKETKDNLQLPELTNLDWREWKKDG